MSVFVDPSGQPTFGIAICGRCSRKFPMGSLQCDPNIPGLMVCKDDMDQYDPYRLAPRQEDKVALAWVRPDSSVATRPAGVIQEAGDAFVITEDDTGYLEI